MSAGDSKTVAVDFDGVLNSYRSGWTGETTITDPPVDGAIEWLDELAQNFDVAIHSVRCGTSDGMVAMYNWIADNDAAPETLESIRFSAEKPKAGVYVDDRGWHFDGTNFPTMEQIREFTPWWKQGG